MFVHDNLEERVGILYDESELNSEISDSNGFIYTPLITKEDVENYEKRSANQIKKTKIEKLISKKEEIEAKIFNLQKELEEIENEQIKEIEEKEIKVISSKYKDKIIEMLQYRIKGQELLDELVNKVPEDKINLCNKCNDMSSWYDCLELCPCAVVCGDKADGEFYDIGSWKIVLGILKNKF